MNNIIKTFLKTLAGIILFLATLYLGFLLLSFAASDTHVIIKLPDDRGEIDFSRDSFVLDDVQYKRYIYYKGPAGIIDRTEVPPNKGKSIFANVYWANNVVKVIGEHDIGTIWIDTNIPCIIDEWEAAKIDKDVHCSQISNAFNPVEDDTKMDWRYLGTIHSPSARLTYEFLEPPRNRIEHPF